MLCPFELLGRQAALYARGPGDFRLQELVEQIDHLAVPPAGGTQSTWTTSTSCSSRLSANPRSPTLTTTSGPRNSSSVGSGMSIIYSPISRARQYSVALALLQKTWTPALVRSSDCPERS